MNPIHATCVALDGRGVLLTGRSGAGKSDLALRLLDRGWRLVSDDAVAVARDGDRLIAAAPATIAGRMEVRGIGIVPVAALPSTAVALVVAIDRPPERMPPAPLPARIVDGIALPEIALDPFEVSAALKVEQALLRYGLPA